MIKIKHVSTAIMDAFEQLTNVALDELQKEGNKIIDIKTTYSSAHSKSFTEDFIDIINSTIIYETPKVKEKKK